MAKENFFVVLGKIYPSFKIEAKLVSMTRAATENEKNVNTEIVVRTFENDFGSGVVSGEVWKKFGYFEAWKPNYSMKKVNFPENILFYLNQSYLTIKKKKSIVTIFFLVRP